MDKMENGGYGIKGLKSWEGRDGYGYQGTLTFENKKIGTFHDEGNGGCMDIDFVSPEAEKKLLTYLRSEHAEISEGAEPYSLFVAGLADELDYVRKIKRSRNKKTVFCLKSEKSEWSFTERHVQAPYSKKVADFIKGKYGDDVLAIANELYEVYPDGYTA